MMGKFISILIPCFNSEKYISETLDSVLSQTYTNWECIVVDDHSTDNSTQVVEEYCQKYPDKIKLYVNPRKGACAARNVAFEKSTGDYIQYLDADDLLSPNKIERQIELFKQFGDDIITNCRWGRFYEKKESVKWKEQSINHDYENPIDWLVDSWIGKGMMANSCWLTPRELIKKARLWDENLLINQDGEFFCRVLLHVKKIIFSYRGTVYYRSGNVKSISNQKSAETMCSQLHSYILYRDNFNQFNTSKSDENRFYAAIAIQLSNFYIQNKICYPYLSRQAKEMIINLNQKLTPQGGDLFKFFCYLFGIDFAIMLRHRVEIFLK
jgi:glycosyltransferase involved in cell wall biosynthesis